MGTVNKPGGLICEVAWTIHQGPDVKGQISDSVDYFNTFMVMVVPSVKRVTTMLMPSNGLSLSTPMTL